MRSYTKAKIEPLIQKYSRVLTLDDVDAIVELDRIASRIEQSADQADASLSDYFSVGGRIFIVPTFARIALIERIQDLYGHGYLGDIGSIYALDIERTGEELSSVPNRRTLLKYRMKIDVPIKRLTQVFLEKLAKYEEGDGESSEGGSVSSHKDYWKMCCILSREIGGSPDEWACAPQSKVEAGASVIDDMIREQQRAAGGSHAPMATSLHFAVKEFGDALRALETLWQE